MSSRTQVAHHIAEVIRTGGDRKTALRDTAAWLRAHGKVRQADYIVRDVMQSLANTGYIVADITSAKPLSTASKKNVESYLLSLPNVKEIECSYKTDTSLIGGLRIDTSLGVLDASVRARLAKIVEGVSR